MDPKADTTGISRLSRPLGGLFRQALRPPTASDEPRFVIQVETVGEASEVCGRGCGSSKGQFIQGAGVGLTEDDASVRARGEALERYCSSVFCREQLVIATAQELGPDAIDLDTLPHCSEAELKSPNCPVVSPNKKARMRWVRGISLLDGRVVYVPVTLVYLYAGFWQPGERIGFPISTGCAAHPSLERAVLAGILEVIERDAISIAWLQKLPLPRIEIDNVPPALAPYWERYQRGFREVEYVFFDATTDLGIPAIYGLQIARANARLTTLVSAGSGLDPAEAIASTMREMASCRIAFRRARPCPEQVEDFADIFHGSTYMARAERAQAFDFLLQSPRKRALSEMRGLSCDSDKQALQAVLGILMEKQLATYVVELSTDEALRAGMRVVRVVIPGLQPLSFNYRARYLGHPRLYQAPGSMGYPVRDEEQLNHWPQPFA